MHADDRSKVHWSMCTLENIINAMPTMARMSPEHAVEHPRRRGTKGSSRGQHCDQMVSAQTNVKVSTHRFNIFLANARLLHHTPVK
jgi:hypothetical protein